MVEYMYIYGPVNSWRLGRSLGIDPISSKIKVCTFDCVYCQVGRAAPTALKRKIFIPTQNIINELNSMPKLNIDYITFSGTGEPTLAKNLGSIIKAIRKLRKEKIAVLTNATLLGRDDIQRELSNVDLVEVKLDASSGGLLEIINKPYKSVSLKKIVDSINGFRNTFKGKLAIQVMFTKDNIAYAKKIAEIIKSIKPDEVHLNTPTRPCQVKPVSKEDIDKIKRYFKGLVFTTVYDMKRTRKIEPISKKSTLKRRGKV